MPNNLATGPNAVVAKQTISFVDAGVTSLNTAIIYRVGNPNQSYVPGRSINAITGFEEGKGYYMVMITAVDFSAFLVPPLDGTTPPPTATKAYQFNSDAQTISVAGGSAFNTPLANPWSIGFFCKILTNTGAFRVGVSTPTQRIWDINVLTGDNGGGETKVHLDATIMNGTNGNSNYLYSASAPVVNVNEFHYYTVTWDGADLKVYVDGVLDTIEVNAGTVTALATGGEFKIGKIVTLTSIDSQTDGLFYASVALTQEQITTLFTTNPVDVSNKTYYASNVAAYYKFDNSLVDAKGNHNGTATTPVFV